MTHFAENFLLMGKWRHWLPGPVRMLSDGETFVVYSDGSITLRGSMAGRTLGGTLELWGAE